MKKVGKLLAVTGAVAIAASAVSLSACNFAKDVDLDNAEYALMEFAYKALQSDNISLDVSVTGNGSYTASYDSEGKTLPAYKLESTMSESTKYLETKDEYYGDAISENKEVTTGKGTDYDGTSISTSKIYMRNGDSIRIQEESYDDAKQTTLRVDQNNAKDYLKETSKDFKESYVGTMVSYVVEFLNDAIDYVQTPEEERDNSSLKAGESRTTYSDLVVKRSNTKFTVSFNGVDTKKGYTYTPSEYYRGEEAYRDYTSTNSYSFELKINAGNKKGDFEENVIPEDVSGQVRYFRSDDLAAIGDSIKNGTAVSLNTLGTGALTYINIESSVDAIYAMAEITYKYDGVENARSLNVSDITVENGVIKISANALSNFKTAMKNSISDFSESKLEITGARVRINYSRDTFDSQGNRQNRYAAYSAISLEF